MSIQMQVIALCACVPVLIAAVFGLRSAFRLRRRVRWLRYANRDIGSDSQDSDCQGARDLGSDTTQGSSNL